MSNELKTRSRSKKTNLIGIEGLESLYKAISSSNVNDITIQNGNSTVRIKIDNTRNTPNIPPKEQKIEKKEKVDNKISNTKQILSDNIGIFLQTKYSVGNKVKVGTTVGFIKFMGMEHDLKSNINGVITEILVEDKQIVEYGQPIFLVKTL